MRREAGYIVTTDGSVMGETLQCAHCNAHWLMEPGSGKTRGWCYSCMAPLCGQGPCVERCAPWEKQMEEMERLARRG